MKRLPFLAMSFLAIGLFLLPSCGGNEEKTATDTMDTTTDTTMPASTATTPASTIVTTPQNMVLTRHKVKDFNKWKASYDAHDSLRLANGIHSYVIGRGVQDTNMVFVAVKVDDMEKAKAFTKDASLKKAMQEGGVTGTPTFKFVTFTFQDTAKVPSNVRSMASFSVKDWDTWKRSFDSGKQLRIDNGLTDRAVGYDADDNHKVTVVTSVEDSARAAEYWKSDTLKKRRAASGVVGEPQRFIFRIVQRY